MRLSLCLLASTVLAAGIAWADAGPETPKDPADVAPATPSAAPAHAVGPVPAGPVNYKLTTLAKGLDHPWSIAFLPDGSMLVTERAGRLRVLRNGELDPTPIAGVPAVYTAPGSMVQSAGQAGLFDVVLHPKFAENHILYLTFATGTAGANATRVVRAKFDGNALTDVQPIFTAAPLKDTANHYGARMVFLADGTFLLTVGEGFEYREKAQDLTTDLGKIVHLNEDGSVPSGNPFQGRPNARPEIWTLGHRNEQGLFFDAKTGRVWETEHGPKGGDEINIIEPGKNYGWPVITYGMDYTGAYVSPYTEHDGMEQPVLYWTPSIAPSGFTIYHGDKFPAWEGDGFAGSLVFKNVRRVNFDANYAVVGQEELFKELGMRIRDVRTGPDGYLYLLTEIDHPGLFGPGGGDGTVVRVEPK
jgi:glucose/arabinose dehydrogenase